MDILKALGFIWLLTGSCLYSLLLLIVSYSTILHGFTSPNMPLNYSGHDPTGVCNVETIQKDPLYPFVHLCATGYCFFCFSSYLQQSHLPLRYVSSQTASQTQISYVAPTTFSLVTAVQVTTDVAFCNFSSESSNDALQLLWGVMALRMALGVVLLILAVISTVGGSIVMYKATKQWQPNHYMKLFAKDGILYFLVYVSPFPILSVPFISPLSYS